MRSTPLATHHVIRSYVPRSSMVRAADFIIYCFGVRISLQAASIESLSSRWPRLQTNSKDLWPEFADHKQSVTRSVMTAMIARTSDRMMIIPIRFTRITVCLHPPTGAMMIPLLANSAKKDFGSKQASGAITPILLTSLCASFCAAIDAGMPVIFAVAAVPHSPRIG